MAVDIYALGATIKEVKDPKMNNRGVWERNFFRLLSVMMDISPQKRPTAKQVSHALTTLHETERSRLEFQLPSTKRARRLLFAAVASHIDVTADRHSCRDATSDHHTTTITTVTTSGRHTTADCHSSRDTTSNCHATADRHTAADHQTTLDDHATADRHTSTNNHTSDVTADRHSSRDVYHNAVVTHHATDDHHTYRYAAADHHTYRHCYTVCSQIFAKHHYIGDCTTAVFTTTSCGHRQTITLRKTNLGRC